MDQSPTLTSTSQAPQSRASFDVLAPLTFLGWRLGLAAIIASVAASFFLCGYALVYWRNADMDLMVIYNALVLNDGKPQQFFDHTGYLTILSVKVWLKALHALGLLDSWSLSTMPPASSPEAFDAAMTEVIRAGRLLAWLIASAAVLVFAGLMRAIVRDWRLFRRAGGARAHHAHRTFGGVSCHFRLDDSDRDRAPREYRAPAVDRARLRSLRDRAGKQGAGGSPDCGIAPARLAVWRTRKRQRCSLAQWSIRSCACYHLRDRRNWRDIGRVAACVDRP
jgi:hypothetical protein